MSIYTGKLQRQDKVRGELKRETPELRVTITRLDAGPQAIIKPAGSYSGVWARAGKFFHGVPRLLDIIYRFVEARLQIRMSRKVKPISAPAAEVRVDRTLAGATEATPQAHPATEATVDQKEAVAVFAAPQAYWRVAAEHIVGHFLRIRSLPVAAPGVAAKYHKPVRLKRKADPVAAPAAIVEARYNTLHTALTAAAIAASAAVSTARKIQALAITTEPVAAPATVGGAARSITTTYNAAPYAWFLTEYTDGTAHVHQCISGVQSGNTVEIDMEAESVYWANAFTHDGTANLVFAQTEPQTSGELELI